MLTINMLSSAQKVAGQGVGSAYHELVEMLNTKAAHELFIKTNSLHKSDITHYHTVDFKFYLSTFLPWWTGRKIGYVHFLPETLDGSIKIPKVILSIFKKYLISFYKKMDNLVVVNPEFIDRLVNLGIKREKITYIPNFVARRKWPKLSVKQNQKFRVQNNLPLDKFLILGVGQIQKRKGIDDFVRLAELNPKIQFVWAGGFSFGSISDGHKHYQKIIKNSPHNLRFLGIIPPKELMRYYNCADLFLLPSFNELFPMSILESCSCGTAVMLRDLNLYKVILAGKYIPAKDVLEMDAQIKKMQIDSSVLPFYQEKAHEVAQKYSEDTLRNVWINFYYEQIRQVRFQ